MRRQYTTAAKEATSLSSGSIAQPSRMSYWNQNSSGTTTEHSPAHAEREKRESLNWPTEALSCWMRSERCPQHAGQVAEGLQEKELTRLGSETTVKLDVRIITSTNINLKEAMEAKNFREDLFYRLDVVKISLPPLRDRLCEIRTIANDLLMKISRKMGIYVERIDNNVFDIFMRYSWPGNIRELENVVERAINLLDQDTVIQTKHLPRELSKAQTQKASLIRTNTPTLIKEIEKKRLNSN